MKAGIITFTYGDNYGQRLQNLAMQEYLKRYFDEVYTIRQIESSLSFKQKIKKLLNKDAKLKNERHQSFVSFDNSYVKYYKVPISEENSYSFPQNDFDYFVVGSDQVWSPYSSDVNSTMFLTFAPIEKRIAIAPSLACEKIPLDKIELYKSYFEGIKYISTREEKGSKLVEDIIGREVPTLLDPTLLHKQSFWDGYVKRPDISIPNKYCFCYCLGSKDDMSEIERICKSKGLEIVDMMSDKKYYTLGPCEFLYLIKNSSLVITDSYHGTIFSYIFKIPFINFKRKGTAINMNSRFETLVHKLGIDARYLYDLKDEDIFNLCFENMELNIENEIDKTNLFMKNILKKGR